MFQRFPFDRSVFIVLLSLYDSFSDLLLLAKLSVTCEGKEKEEISRKRGKRRVKELRVRLEEEESEGRPDPGEISWSNGSRLEDESGIFSAVHRCSMQTNIPVTIIGSGDPAWAVSRLSLLIIFNDHQSVKFNDLEYPRNVGS